MIFIKKYNNQSEKSNKLLSQKNDIVSEDSSIKKLIDVDDEEEKDIYIHISDHSHTVNYDKLNEHKGTTKAADKDTSSIKKLMKKEAKSKNYAQLEQNLKNATAEENYIPPTLQPKGEYNASMSKPTEMYSVGSNNEMLSDGSAKSLVSSTSFVSQKNNNAKKTYKTDKSRRKSLKPNTLQAKHNGSYTLVDNSIPVQVADKMLVLDNVSQASELSADISQGKIEQMLSKSALSVNTVSRLPSERRKYYSLYVKRHHLNDLQNNVANTEQSTVDVENRQYRPSNANAPAQQQNQHRQQNMYSVVDSNTGTTAKIGSPRIKNTTISIKRTAANIALNHHRSNIVSTKKKGIEAKKAIKLKEPLSIGKQYSSDMVNLVGNTAHTTLKTTKSSLYSVTHSAFDGAAERTAEASGVSSLYTVVETGKNVKAGYRTIVNTTQGALYTVNGAAHFVKAVPKKTKRALHFYNRVKKMNFQRLRKYSKIKLQSFAKQVKNSVAKQLKALIAAVLAIFTACAAFMIFIGCLIGGIFSTFTWQTSRTIDTTKLMQYISELDYGWQHYIRENTKTKEQADVAEDDVYYYYYAYNKSDTEACYELDDKGRPINIRGYTSVGYYDEMPDEVRRYTTQDYVSALSYLQMRYGNLAWYQTIVGAVGDALLKGYARDLHDLTHSLTTETYTYIPTVGHSVHHHYYFYKQYSIDYLIDNNIISLTEEEKEKYHYTCAYGNAESADLQYPLHRDIDIVGHYGYHIDPETGHSLMHNGIDLKCSPDEAVYSPISGWVEVYSNADKGTEIRVYNTNPSSLTQNSKWVSITLCESSVINNPIVDGIMEYTYVNAGDLIGYAGNSDTYNKSLTDCLAHDNHIHMEYIGYDDSHLVNFAPEAFLAYPEN